MPGNQGQIEIDFGGSGLTQTSVSVIGQYGITSNSLTESWMAVDLSYVTGNLHSDHIDDDIILRAGDITPGVGFEIYGVSLIGSITGKYLVNWAWNDLGGISGVGNSRWYNGFGIPSPGLGSDNDYFLRNDNGDVYYKSGGVWTIITNIFSLSQYTNFTAFPGTGLINKIYIAKDTRLSYYWDSITTSYIKIGSFNNDFTVYLDQTSGFKTFMKWKNLDLVPATDKHPKELLLEGAVEAIAPNVTLTSSSTIAFNQSSITNVLNFTKSVNAPGTSIATVSLEWRRNNTGAWTVLSTNTALTTYTHGPFTDPLSFSGATNSGGTNTQPFNYRYVVTDNLGGTKTVTKDIIPASYVAPTLSSFTAGTNLRELGNISSTITGTITKNSTNVNLTSYVVQYQVNGTGGYTDIGSPTSISGASSPVSVAHNNIALVNSNSLNYRVKIVDAYQTAISSFLTLGSFTINFTHKNLLVYDTVDRTSSNLFTASIIDGLSTNLVYQNSQIRTISGVTASGSQYTYYLYASASPNLVSVIMDGVLPVLGAFTQLSNTVSATNSYGATVVYKVYKSVQLGAFTSNTLAFS